MSGTYMYISNDEVLFFAKGRLGQGTWVQLISKRSKQVRLAIMTILRLHPGSTVILAPVCSSFSYMCSSQACRYFFMPEGNTELPFVISGNVMSVRVTLMCYLCACLGIVFIVEQPGSGKFGEMPRWLDFCQNFCYVLCLQAISWLAAKRIKDVVHDMLQTSSNCCYVCEFFWEW